MYRVFITCMIKGTNFNTNEPFEENFWISSEESKFEWPCTEKIEDCEGPKNLLAQIVDLDYQWMNPKLLEIDYFEGEGVYIYYRVEIPLETKLFPPYFWKPASEMT